VVGAGPWEPGARPGLRWCGADFRWSVLRAPWNTDRGMKKEVKTKECATAEKGLGPWWGRARVLTLGISAVILFGSWIGTAAAADCGGAVVCACGDRVVENTVLDYDIGPCAWPEGGGSELVGIRVDSNVTLDCDGHRILGPADAQKEEFGVKFGSSTRPVENAVLRNCEVSGFWWGVYVTDSTNVTIEDNHIHDNGWKDPTQNGTGYGIDVANASNILVQGNEVDDNGNEGMHISNSTGITLRNNILENNGLEQIYFYFSDDSFVEGNIARGGTQGLEMRSSSRNAFSYNQWLDSPLQWLEDDNEANTFVYDHFEGTLKVTNGSSGNTFTVCSFAHPSGLCVDSRPASNVLDRPWFEECNSVVAAKQTLAVERPVRGPSKAKNVVITYPGCNADIDGSGFVDGSDLGVVSAALGTSVGDPAWNPEADLNHDGVVNDTDNEVAAGQLGPCPTQAGKVRAKLGKDVLIKVEKGQPQTIELTADGSLSVSGPLVHYELRMTDKETGAELWTRTWGLEAPADVVDVRSYPPGKYQAYLTVTDAFWNSKVKKRKLKVR
jgi:parallel beta-helix repeat protein